METDFFVECEGDWMSAEEEELYMQALDKLEEQHECGLGLALGPNGADSCERTLPVQAVHVPASLKDSQQLGLGLKAPYTKLEARTLGGGNETVRVAGSRATIAGLVVQSNGNGQSEKPAGSQQLPKADSRDMNVTQTHSTNGAPVYSFAVGLGGPTENDEEFEDSTDEHKTPEMDITIAETPLEIYRGKYLKVTDLTAQAWCEQQLVYSFSVPREVLETPAMTKGTDIHLVKELEVHDIEQVDVTTREDSWAVKVLNIFIALTQLVSGSRKIREMPIFGEPFGQGVFFSGIIDEIRWKEDEKLELVEFKTRVKSKTLPSAAQKRTHKMQVSLYKHMFDNGVRGLLKKEALVDHLGLQLDRPLSDSVTQHLEKLDLHTNDLSGILDATLEKFQFLPQISTLTTEYTSQIDSAMFASESYDYDEVWLMGEVDRCLQYWRGEREPVGVDIEEAWKCHSCLFEETCVWKQRQIAECIRKNSIKRAKIH